MNKNIISIKTITHEEANRFASELGLVNKTPPLCTFCSAEPIKERRKLRHGVNMCFRCKNRNCRKFFGVLDDSIFHRSNISIYTMLSMIYFYASKDTVVETGHEAEVSHSTPANYYI